MVGNEIPALSPWIFGAASMATVLLTLLVYSITLLRREVPLWSTSGHPFSSVWSWFQSRTLTVLRRQLFRCRRRLLRRLLSGLLRLRRLLLRFGRILVRVNMECHR